MAIDLATAYVPIQPSAKGLAGGLADELGDVVERAARVAADRASDVIGDGVAEGVEGGGNGNLAGKAAVVGTLIGTAIAVGIVGAINVEGAQDKLSAQLGASGAYAEELGGIAGKLYADAYGENLTQVNDALKNVLQNGVLPEDATNESIERITAKVLDLTTAFDEDLSIATQAVGTIMRTGLAKDADEALDVITRGMQQGANKAGDLLEVFQEYSTLFRDIGIDAQTATGLLGQGLRAGARDADTVADALKEFAIRGQDASESSAAGFKAIGLNAADMTRAIAAGGPAASNALDQVLDGLRNMADPVARNAAAVALFGTKAEDLGDALFALDPTTAAQGLGTVTGAAEKLGDTLNDNVGTKLESFKRGALQKLTDFIGTTVLPALNRLGDWWTSVRPQVDAVAAVVGGVIISSFDKLGSAIGFLSRHLEIVVPLLAGFAAYKSIALIATGIAKAKSLWAAAQVALNVAMNANPIALIITALVALGAGVVVAYQKFEGFRNVVDTVGRFLRDEVWPILQQVGAFLADVFSVAVEKLSALWSNVLQPAVAGVTDFFTSVLLPVIESVAGFLSDVLGGAISFVADHWRTVWDPLSSFVTGLFDRIRGVIEGVMRQIRGVIDVVMGLITGDWGRAWGGIKDFFGGIWDQIKALTSGGIEAVLDFFRKLPGRIASFAGTILDGAKKIGSAIWQGIIDGITGAAAFVGDIAKKIWNGIAGFINDKFILPIARFTVNIPFIGELQPFKIAHGLKIPTFHEGGVVQGRPGEEVLIRALAGETILPTHEADFELPDGLGRGSGRFVGQMIVQTNESPRQWMEEGMWRVTQGIG